MCCNWNPCKFQAQTSMRICKNEQGSHATCRTDVHLTNRFVILADCESSKISTHRLGVQCDRRRTRRMQRSGRVGAEGDRRQCREPRGNLSQDAIEKQPGTAGKFLGKLRIQHLALTGQSVPHRLSTLQTRLTRDGVAVRRKERCKSERNHKRSGAQKVPSTADPLACACV